MLDLPSSLTIDARVEPQGKKMTRRRIRRTHHLVFDVGYAARNYETDVAPKRYKRPAEHNGSICQRIGGDPLHA